MASSADAAFHLPARLAAAALHASWNAIVKRGPDKFLGTVLVTGSAALLSAACPFPAFPAAHSWPWLAASVLLQVTYYGLVARCYQQVDMSLAYPLMRGSAPILVALAGTLLGEPLPAAAWLGVVLVSTGIRAWHWVRAAASCACRC